MNVTYKIGEMLKQADALMDSHHLPEAKTLYAEICALDIGQMEARMKLGVVTAEMGSIEEGISLIQEAIQQDPGCAEAHLALGNIYHQFMRTAEASACFGHAVAADPGNIHAWEKMAGTLKDLGKTDALNDCYRGMYQLILRKDPDNIPANMGQGLLLAQKGEYACAESCFTKVLSRQPDHIDALSNLSRVYYHTSHIGAAVDLYAAILKVIDAGYRGDNAQWSRLRFETHSNLLFALNYLPGIDPRSVFDEHRQWSNNYSNNFPEPVFENKPDPGRKLRIGYVSPDFRRHSVAFFMQPVLANHNLERVETFCYADVANPDTVTEHLKSLASNWRNINGQFEQVRQDRIDILVDLAGHTTNNRLLAFARRAAPVQVTYLGYPNTTGLSMMDYRLTDAIADPEDNDPLSTEKLVRLPDSFLCFAQPLGSPGVKPAPVLETGTVTFGSFNALAKVNSVLVAAWVNIVKAIPGSRLLIKSPGFTDVHTRKRILSLFNNSGVTTDSIELVSWVPGYREHLDLYGKIDIALDTFPYNGTTTTCEALWMGVPVVTLAESHHAGRVGASILNALGLQRYIAQTVDNYVEIAVDLANDPGRFSQLRYEMRKTMVDSPLCDETRFIRKLEDAYREMWGTWCSGGS